MLYSLIGIIAIIAFFIFIIRSPFLIVTVILLGIGILIGGPIGGGIAILALMVICGSMKG